MTRMPCLHPGDIQIFNSIFKEELKDYVNVVVFSQKGQRPACNKLSCGDLDGDNFSRGEQFNLEINECKSYE